MRRDSMTWTSLAALALLAGCRSGAPEPIPPVTPASQLRGIYTYMADAGRFTDCRTGAAYPVAPAGANAALERAYGEAGGIGGKPLLIVITGRLEDRESMEGGRREKQVVVDQVERVGPETTCGGPSNATVENSYWKLMALGGLPTRTADDVPEAHLLLHPDQKRASGSTGCNRFSGGYLLNGDSLRFDQLVSTRRACLDPDLNRQEQGFLEALDETRTWRVTGDTLDLSGEDGPAARFVVQYLR